MAHLTLDLSIVCIFLVAILWMGIRARKKNQTIAAYAVANKTYGTIPLVMAYFAADIGTGTILSDTATVFEEGIILPVTLLTLSIAYIIRATLITPKLIYFAHCLTLGEIMGVYGKFARILSGILSTFNATILAGIQLMALGLISESLLGINGAWASIIGGLIMASYTAIGGMRSITVTSMFHFFVLTATIPLVAYAAVHHAGGIEALFQKTAAEKLMIFGHKQFYCYLLYACIFVLQIGMIDPTVVQRMLMAPSSQQLRNKYLAIAIIDPMFRCLIILIGLSGLVLFPSSEANQIVPKIIQELLPIGIKGIAISGLFAIAMSSTDAYLHIAGLTLAHDVIYPLYQHKKSLFKEVQIARVATFGTGLVAIIIGINRPNFHALIIASISVISPILMVPFMCALFGLKPEKKAFMASLGISLMTFIVAKCLLPAQYASPLAILISTCFSLIAFLLVHIILNRGYAILKRPLYNPITSVPYVKKKKKKRKGWRLKIRKILHNVQHNLYQSKPPYVLTGMFCGFDLIAHRFINEDSIKGDDAFLMILRFIGIICCVLLIIKDQWSKRLQTKYLPLFFLATLLYCLPFLNTIMVISTQGNIIWLTHMLLALLFLMVLVDWLNIIILSSLGITFALLLMIFHMSVLTCPSFTHAYYYLMAISLIIGLTFAYTKQKRFNQLKEQKTQLLHVHMVNELDHLYNLQYQLLQKENLLRKDDLFQHVKNTLQNLSDHNVDEQENIQKSIAQIDSFIEYYKNSLYNSVDYIKLNVEYIELHKLLSHISKALSRLNIHTKVQVQINTKARYLYCDHEKIVELLVNSFTQLQPKEYTEILTLSLQDTTLYYQLHAISDINYKRKIPALGFVLTTKETPLTLRSTYEVNTQRNKSSIPNNINDLVECKKARMLNAHYGHREHATNQSTTQIYIIPLDLRKLRSKILDTLPIQDGLLETEASLLEEKALLEEIASRTSIDLQFIQRVINQVKYIHRGQFRKSGELFYTHPVAVATLLLDMTQDSDAIVAALLHDTIEDSFMNLDEITYQYGKTVAFIVDKVTNLDFTIGKTQLTSEENHQKLAIYKDPRVIMVKLADRLHNLLTIGFHPIAKQRRITIETLEFYIPLGRQLKLDAVNQIVDKIESICKSILKTEKSNLSKTGKDNLSKTPSGL